MLRSINTAAARLTARIATRRANGRVDGSCLDGGQGKVLEAARPSGESGGDARLLVRATARAAPEREARRRRRRDGQEAAAAADGESRAVGREARVAGASGDGGGARGSRATGARAQVGRTAAA